LVLSILWLGGLGSILAVIFGVIALSHIRQSQGRTQGGGLATAGLVIGIVGILGAVMFYVLLAAVGTGVHQLVQSLMPTDLQLGQTGTYSAQENGVVGITVSSVKFPVKSSDQFVTPSAGSEFAVATVKECAGPDGVPNGIDTLGWQLVFPQGTTVDPTLDAKNPGIDSINAIGAGKCVTGYITFQIAAGSKPSYIEYFGAFIHPYRWRLP
jgi:hypothetical protein